jgi:hypothetical protein
MTILAKVIIVLIYSYFYLAKSLLCPSASFSFPPGHPLLLTRIMSEKVRTAVNEILAFTLWVS